MAIQKLSPCKVNLLLNILRRRADGFHELETLMHPVALHDRLEFEIAGDSQVELTCTVPGLPTDSRNLVHRAATLYLETAGIKQGVRIHLEKHIPMAAGLGGGSGNAAIALLGLNDLFGGCLTAVQLYTLAAKLGSDVPFFLQPNPALATGRGENIEALPPLPVLQGKVFLLIHPGFGIATAWAYQQLARFPSALNGTPGRARALADLLQAGRLQEAAAAFYNSLEAPALEKFPILQLYQEFLRQQGALGTLMSGSGSTTFALMENAKAAEQARTAFRARFGETAWVCCVPI